MNVCFVCVYCGSLYKAVICADHSLHSPGVYIISPHATGLVHTTLSQQQAVHTLSTVIEQRAHQQQSYLTDMTSKTNFGHLCLETSFSFL